MIEVKEIKTYAKRIPVNVIEPDWKRYIELPLEQSTLKKRISLLERIEDFLLIYF